MNVKRPLKAKHPILQARMSDFVKFLRTERMVVSLRVVQVRARMIAYTLSLKDFKASRRWVEKFIRRNGIQSSIKIHGKDNAKLPEEHRERIEEIKSIATQYKLSNIYNQDESGLFYRLCQNRSYLSRSEYRSGARGSCLQKAKQRLTVSFCTNCDGSHRLPIRYIGKSASPNCFKSHPTAKTNYSSQTNAWMDGKKFKECLLWWFTEVSKVSTGPWLLLLHNCGGHNVGLSLPRVRIEFLPPGTTVVHQSLDMGIIAAT